MADKYNPFTFNLMPPVPKEEIELIEERDDSVLYSFLLIFFVAIVYLAVVLVQGLLISPRVINAQQAIIDREELIDSYQFAQTLNGELFAKTKSLKPVLDLQIDSSEIFRVGAALEVIPDFAIESYGREKTGSFVFKMVSPDFAEVESLLMEASEIEGISNIFVRSSVLDESNSVVRTTLVLDIDAA